LSTSTIRKITSRWRRLARVKFGQEMKELDIIFKREGV
jgi:hypothetical protein